MILELVNKEKVNKCFKITYLKDTEEIIMADSMGITEDLQGFIAFYNEDDLVCIVNQGPILKIETVVAPKKEFGNNGY